MGTTYTVDRGIATITLDEPDARNALSVSLVTGLLGDLDRAVADDGVRVIVVTNAGGTFCAGADLRAVGALAEQGIGLPEIFERIMSSPTPVVGRIAGHCRGGGIGLAAACDLSVAVDTATFAFSEVRLGVAPAVISVVCLPKLRAGDAADLFLRGRTFTAAHAARSGLINEVVAEADLDAAVAAITDDLVAGGPEALAAAKELLRTVPALDRDSAFEWTAELSQRLFGSEEGREGVAAFREKRPPSWSADA